MLTQLIVRLLPKHYGHAPLLTTLLIIGHGWMLIYTVLLYLLIHCYVMMFTVIIIIIVHN